VSDPTPQIADAFGPHLDAVRRYVDLLITDGVTRGVIGPRENDRIWDRHIVNSVALSELIPVASRVVDIGSGAGKPGVPLALVRPDLAIELLEPMQRRVDFLSECLRVLGLDNAVVRRGRAPEDLRGTPDTVAVVRAVAPLASLIGMTGPVLKAGGVVLALKGRNAADEVAAVPTSDPTLHLEVLSPTFAGSPATVVRVCRRPRLGPRNRRAPVVGRHS
jgi:16S rRNA (guanine527-N7)-methyltransferase